jgi:hypothetical protein
MLKKQELRQQARLSGKVEMFKEVMEEVVKRSGGEGRVQIFNEIVLPWMMINQRALALSQEQIVKLLEKGAFDDLLDSTSKRVREGKVSKSTGGYSQARTGLREKLVIDLSDTVTAALLGQHKTNEWHGRQVILLDGTTVALYSTKELKSVYPVSKNQHGESHWSVPRILLMHDLVTGVALRPEFGATGGPQAISETEMLKAALGRCPKGSVIVGDCNFGILRVVDMAQRSGHPVLLQLTASRANKFLKTLKNPGECRVTWTPTEREKVKYGEISEQQGRFIWLHYQQDGCRSTDIYFFTTLEEPVEEIAKLYRRRWEIEQDIKSLKTTMSLDKIVVRTPEMFRKEFILGVLAYNLVRDIMAMVAKKINIDPRRLSFSAYLFELRTITNLPSKSIFSRTADPLEKLCLRPSINKKRIRPSQPRAVRHKTNRFPQLIGDRTNPTIKII